CRLAEAGEFSRRAFANGNMDLTEAEALSDLIAAETEAQRRLALRLATGAGHDRYQDWTDRLVRILALIEAAVDFPEDDLPR
ncbi:MAG TPA: tRNA uridine-5-carboxymethylaminomethyl(34) synthesis GTPase MnmE, partial [Rhodospirillaceae bacterium]|nr:tRNA uridine-5-carboxymethylaminomethyl(34) synthesis GTPase MnmE [Rhodospirillaceae bacterium]